MSGKTCAFTGHRAAKLPWRFNENDSRCLALKARLYDVLETLCESGVEHCICGMANGCDLYFAEAVLLLQQRFPALTLEAAVPYAGQSERWFAGEKRRYEHILSRCSHVEVISEVYTRSCMMKRNRYMVDRCDLLLGCYDGQEGGTLSTLRYAMKQGKEVIVIPVCPEED